MPYSLFQHALQAGRESEAKRITDLYTGIWAKDPNYGTELKWVSDTTQNRISPHMASLEGAGRNWRIVDFGAGDGRFLDSLTAQWYGSVGTGVDIHIPAGSKHQWRQQLLWEPINERFDYAISCDTLEHLPEWAVPDTLRNIRASAPHGFLRISTRPDTYGTKRGLRLHETVRQPEWWIERLSEAGITPQKYMVYCGSALEVYY
jgi:2-polyprenyl-3-methyl-5-hydroxy-6-metoxy-1,4-benzoquinol methylase